MSASNWVHIDVEKIEAETDKAFLLKVEDMDEAVWIPRSHIADHEDYRKGMENCTISISDWIAKQRGLG